MKPRAQLAARRGRLCEHGYAKKTDGRGRPYCPHGCGFPHSQRPTDGKPDGETALEGKR